jgi:16S rRNA (cytidine1402-2'-O)-methyltransferase
MSIADHVASFEAQGMTRKEAMKAVAVARGMSRRDVYQELLSE